jgi:hypothetical protein
MVIGQFGKNSLGHEIHIIYCKYRKMSLERQAVDYS